MTAIPTLTDILEMMETQRIAGVVRAVSPISHGDGRLGTTTLLRTMRTVQPDGSTADVPIVSGNSIRGKLRRVSADINWRETGRPVMTSDAFAAMVANPQNHPEHLYTSGRFRVLYQGGSLTKEQKRMPSDKVTRIRELVPHLALFGWSGGGRIVQGQSKVAAMVPLCDETAHILDSTVDGSLWERVQVMDFSRMEDTVRSPHAKRIKPGDEGTSADEDSTQMRYGTQVIAAGTPMQWAFAVENPTQLERAWARLVLTVWAAEGGTVGGRSAAGLGSVSIADISGWQVTDDDVAIIRDHFTDHRDEIVEAVSWLG